MRRIANLGSNGVKHVERYSLKRRKRWYATDAGYDVLQLFGLVEFVEQVECDQVLGCWGVVCGESQLSRFAMAATKPMTVAYPKASERLAPV